MLDVAVIAFFSFGAVARVVRGQVLSIREKEYIEAARPHSVPATLRIMFEQVSAISRLHPLTDDSLKGVARSSCYFHLAGEVVACEHAFICEIYNIHHHTAPGGRAGAVRSNCALGPQEGEVTITLATTLGGCHAH